MTSRSSAARTSALSTARTEDFRDEQPLNRRDCAALGVLLGFLLFLAFNFFVDTSALIMTIVSFAVPAALSVVLFLVYRPLLHRHWAAFRSHLGKNLLIVLGCFIGLHLVLFLVRLPFGELFTAGPLTPVTATIELQDATSWLTLVVGFLATTSPVFVAFVEDTVFRHTLLAKIPVWNRGLFLQVILVLVNSFLFGAMHIWAFGGSLPATLPYMVIGLLMNVLYLWTRNLWFVLGTHILFNSVALLGAVPLFIFKVLGL